ncbi:MAG: formylglycine-generating enzyme family protein [Planctomycetaceae bacterium]
MTDVLRRLPWLLVLAGITAVCISAAASADDTAKTDKAADPMRGTKAGQVRDDNGLKMKLAWCPPGVVTMEQIEEVDFTGLVETRVVDGKPVRVDKSGVPIPGPKTIPVRVFLTRGYWLGKYEVTQAEWKQIMGTAPWKGQNATRDGDEFPVTCINWDDALEFCHALTLHERTANRLSNDWEYTLPTEAQWERACRARTETAFSFDDDESQLGDYAWFEGNAANLDEKYAHRVGQKKPNPWGLCDMHGNAWEWCRDFYMVKPPGGRDPLVTTEYSRVAQRGGGWNNPASFCRSALRSNGPRATRNAAVGFRVALVPVRPEKQRPETR